MTETETETQTRTGRTLVAGVGNVFLGDDGFGVEVARLLARHPRRDGVEIADFGIRGVHLVYELLDGCDLFAMLASMGGRPGRSLLVACEPADVSAGMGLSGPVRAALPHAVRAVEDILSQIGQKEGVRDGAQGDHGGGGSDAGVPGGHRPAGS
jgi:Ni,Fe-hydrogenase maturation factor